MLSNSSGVNPDQLPVFDICVIGAGAAGISLALELERAGKSVCLLESGGEKFEAESQALCMANDTDLYSGALTGRLRMLGGSTNHWGGRTGTLDALDMSEKAWVPNSGWPIQRADLDPFYARARGLCKVANAPDVSASVAAMPEFIRNGTRDMSLCTWWRAPNKGPSGLNFATTYKDHIAASSRILLITHANVVRFVQTPDHQGVAAVDARSIGGWRAEIRANQFILAGGGIENSRLLLIGNGQTPLGNANTGRYFLQHLRGRVAKAYFLDSDVSLSRHLSFNVLNTPDDQPIFQTGLQLTPECRIREGLLNASAFLNYHDSPGTEGFREIIAGLKDGYWISDLGERTWDVVHDSYLMGNLVQGTLRRSLPKQYAEISIDVEQVPSADSRITLSDQRDALGVPLPQIDWHNHPLERRSMRKLALALTSELARLRIARSQIAEWVTNEDMSISDGTFATFHFSGGTRMSDKPDRGVVDTNAKVFGVDNLYVCGSSVFPSIGHMNPTLTIVALATRLADHLSAKP